MPIPMNEGRYWKFNGPFALVRHDDGDVVLVVKGDDGEVYETPVESFVPLRNRQAATERDDE